MREDDFRRVVTTLTRFLGGFGIGRDDAEELAQETLVHAHAQDLRDIERPGAFLFWTARNRAIDRLRHDRRQARTEALAVDARTESRYSTDDDASAGLLDRGASADLVEHALRASNAAEDPLVARVVGAWLELANELGTPPSSRQVAARVGVSHTSVNQALRRFRSYVPPVG